MELPTQTKDQIGAIKIHKGSTKTQALNLVTWDAVPQCDVDTCPIEGTCPYSKIGTCGLRRSYQKHVVDSVLSCFKEMTPDIMLKVGMHLIPLYSQLVHMKVHSLNAPAMVISRGSLVPNPIFKEIRAIIREVSVCMDSLGMPRELLGKGIPKHVGDSHDPSVKGDLTYYDEMMGSN